MIESVFNFSSVPTAVDTPLPADPHNDYERLTTLSFHLATGDYFPFLATLLGFVEETFASGDRPQELVAIQLDAIRAARKDLKYLQDNCRIAPRS